MTAETLATEETFVQNVVTAIAKSFMVEVGDVTATIQVARRLRTLSESLKRRATTSNLLVDYEVKTMFEEKLTNIKSVMQDSNSRNEFASTFQTEIQDLEKVSGRSIVIDKVKAEEVTVTVMHKEQVAPNVVIKGPNMTTSETVLPVTIPSGNSSVPTSEPSGDQSASGAPRLKIKDRSPSPTPSPPSQDVIDDDDDNGDNDEDDISVTTTTRMNVNFDDIPGGAVGCTPHVPMALIAMWFGSKVAT